MGTESKCMEILYVIEVISLKWTVITIGCFRQASKQKCIVDIQKLMRKEAKCTTENHQIIKDERKRRK